MVVDEGLLERLEQLQSKPFEGDVFRHTIGDTPPEVESVRGARWNPPEVPAIYTSLDRDTALAEGDHLLNSQTPRPQVRRVVHRIRVGLQSVLELSREVLAELGVDLEALRSDDHWACQRVGEAARRLGYDGILVPSARADGPNLVILPSGNPRDHAFDVLESEVIEDPGL